MDSSTIMIISSLISLIFFILGVPIFLVIGLWVAGVSIAIDFTLSNISSTLFEGLNFFGLLALPLFILTGDLIKHAGIAKKLADFAYACVGNIRGGMGMSAITSSGLFAAISGSNAGTTATIGSIMYPEMTKNGYSKTFSAATIAAGGTVGIIIPPSIIFIVYGLLLDLSISELFVGGMIPGLLMVFAMQFTCYYVSKKNNYGKFIDFDIRRIGKTAVAAYLGFLAIFIVVYGIYSGLFSPTEAASITVGFSILAGMLITRTIKIKDIPNILMKSGQINGMLTPLVAISIVMQQILSILGAQEFISTLISGLNNPTVILLACMLLVLLAGTVLESLPNTIILAPILAPIAYTAGVDPIHFAVIFLIGDAIGFITPPYGLNLYVASALTGIPYFEIVKQVLPYLFGLTIVWLLVAFIPSLSKFLVQFSGV